MKKLVFLFIFISSLCLGAWENIKLENDFKEKTGSVATVCDLNSKGFIKIEKYEKEYLLVIYPGEFITNSDFVNVKIKFDKGEVFGGKGNVSKDGRSVYIDINDNVIEHFKKGNWIKIVIYPPYTKDIFRQATLTNFTNTFNKLR